MTDNLDEKIFNEAHEKVIKMNDEQFKEMAKHEEATTKDVSGPLAISPEILKSVQKGLEEAKEGKLLDSPEDFSKYVEPETIKISGKKDKKLKPKSYYCSTCREWFLEDKSDKRPMGFDRNEDGSMTMKSTRFSVFCPSCSKFISIIDPETDAKIKDAIDKVGNK